MLSHNSIDFIAFIRVNLHEASREAEIQDETCVIF